MLLMGYSKFILLSSRNGEDVLVVTYADVNRCLENAFLELSSQSELLNKSAKSRFDIQRGALDSLIYEEMFLRESDLTREQWNFDDKNVDMGRFYCGYGTSGIGTRRFVPRKNQESEIIGGSRNRKF